MEKRMELLKSLAKDLGEVMNRPEVLDEEHGQIQGKELRKSVPRSSHGEWEVFEGRPDPVALLKEQGEIRVQELLPERHLRMSASPFTFYRGAALIMASDLSHTPNTGITVQACGDAHISNFGIFGSPEGDLVFDINDFDETAPGPWEWDLKRLAASVQICAEDLQLSKKQAANAVRACCASYRQSMLDFAQMSALDVWYAHASTASIEKMREHTREKTNKKAAKTIKKAQQKDNSRAVVKLTEVVDGERRFRNDPPVLIPLCELVNAKTGKDISGLTPQQVESVIALILKGYYDTLAPDKQHLLSQYTGVDVAHKIVGVGSVGTMDWIILLQGGKQDDFLVLQIKEAQKSVLERFVGDCGVDHSGQRVVQGQRAMQTASDFLLGWTSSKIEINGMERHFYVRQLWNYKGSIELEDLSVEDLNTLATLCGWTLAHAHARTGNRFLIAGYLGKSDVFDEAIVRFAAAYSKQNQADFQRFMDAIESGELPCAEARE